MPVTPRIVMTVSGDYWWPRWSPDGQRLVAGNTTLRIWSRDASWRELPPRAPDRAWRMARWRSAEELYVLDTIHATGDPVALVVISATTGATTPAGFSIDPAALSVNWAEAVRGHWAGVRAADGSLFVDGRRLPSSRRFHGLTTDGHAVLTTTETEWVVVPLPLDQGEWTSPRPPRSNEYALSWRQIVFGDGDRVRLQAPARDVTVAPWGKERLPLLRSCDDPDEIVDTLWLWTASERPDGTPLLLGRPLGAPDAIVIEGVAAKAWDVIYRDSSWDIAAYSDHEGHGRPGLVLLSVPADAPRERLVAQPAPPPAPEVWAPTNDEVDLWALFTGSGANQYPRRNPDDPGVYWDCQLARMGQDVEHAWFIKTQDGRVYEWRALLTDHVGGQAWICLLEDHDEDGRTYQFEDPRLCPNIVRAGDIYERDTRLREWDHGRRQWGPWTGPGSDGRFRFRVRVASVERSSYGRIRASVEVDTYQDLEIFELYSNKGWSAWEEWRRSLADTGARTRTLIDGMRVGFSKRVEWPERYEGPRAWPVRPFGRWPREMTAAPPPPPSEQPRVTIVEPAIWPVEATAPASLRCVAEIHGTAGTITWTRRDATGAVAERVVNPAWDLDHTFRASVSGTWWISASIERDGRTVDQTARERKWVVRPADAVDDPPVTPPPPDARYEIYGNFLANGIERWGFMALSWWVHDRPRFERFCRAYVEAGYRHLPVALYGAYPGERPYDLRRSPDRAVEAVMALLDRGIDPILMLVTDEPDGRPSVPAANIEWIRDEFARIWLALPSHHRIHLCLGWEINQIVGYREDGNPRQGHELLALAHAIWLMTGRASWVHFTPNWWGPHYEDGDEVRWWRDVGEECCGLLAQIRPDAPITLELEADPSAPDGLYLMLRYPRACDGAAGICGRLKALGKRFVLFEHSRDLERWKRVEAIVREDGRVDGIC